MNHTSTAPAPVARRANTTEDAQGCSFYCALNYSSASRVSSAFISVSVSVSVSVSALDSTGAFKEEDSVLRAGEGGEGGKGGDEREDPSTRTDSTMLRPIVDPAPNPSPSTTAVMNVGGVGARVDAGAVAVAVAVAGAVAAAGIGDGALVGVSKDAFAVGDELWRLRGRRGGVRGIFGLRVHTKLKHEAPKNPHKLKFESAQTRTFPYGSRVCIFQRSTSRVLTLHGFDARQEDVLRSRKEGQGNG